MPKMIATVASESSSSSSVATAGSAVVSSTASVVVGAGAAAASSSSGSTTTRRGAGVSASGSGSTQPTSSPLEYVCTAGKRISSPGWASSGTRRLIPNSSNPSVGMAGSHVQVTLTIRSVRSSMGSASSSRWTSCSHVG